MVEFNRRNVNAAERAAASEPGQKALLRSFNVELHHHSRTRQASLRAREDLAVQEVGKIDGSDLSRDRPHCGAGVQKVIQFGRGAEVAESVASKEESGGAVGRAHCCLAGDCHAMACSSIGRLDCFQARVVRRIRFKAKCAEP
eukprot:CAMPEP_0179850026 /NCGR_PEP_ID=MMETSP0982-20121206/7476_1 /TAXON_ID=483367 /ORGANISM="non described non described, Strain CCMP 2436" /LENGTH=142 /DNA_ID=CAMNT_0021735409 /DNA_START=359 /DNA_END=787 /DNA_ORIENTATION=+